MVNYLASQGIYPWREQKNRIDNGGNSRSGSSVDHPNFKGIIPKEHALILNLSRRVDCMVIACVLAFLPDQRQFQNLYLVACHVDYGKRPKSIAEAC